MQHWVDKYRPRAFSELTCHPNITRTLRLLANDKEFPHVLFYGPNGAGKKTRVSCLLQELYNHEFGKVNYNVRRIFNNDGTEKEATLVSSSTYHCELRGNMGFNDHTVIQSLVNELGSIVQTNLLAPKQFKVLILHEADSMSKLAQGSLRRAMEIYTKNLRIILCCNCVGKIMDPLKSRCQMIRVPAPSHEEIANVLNTISNRENFTIDLGLPKRITDASGKDLGKAIDILQNIRSRWSSAASINEYINVPLYSWEVKIERISILVIRRESQNANRIQQIIGVLTEMLEEGGDPTVIIKKLAFTIVAQVDEFVKGSIIDKAADYVSHNFAY
ncbi:hypothetical protein G9A89_013281 [Geosiphon pyriformis]|nr:hypothetical protein G9A89_013281 [Geosiphon pyriformis]